MQFSKKHNIELLLRLRTPEGMEALCQAVSSKACNGSLKETLLAVKENFFPHGFDGVDADITNKHINAIYEVFIANYAAYDAKTKPNFREAMSYLEKQLENIKE
jgi:hypothetical protein